MAAHAVPLWPNPGRRLNPKQTKQRQTLSAKRRRVKKPTGEALPEA